MEDLIQKLITPLSGHARTTATLIKRGNDIYRIEFDKLTAYLKLYTKDWYGDDSGATGFCVEHETAAWDRLAAAGLAVPEVLDADTTCTNPIGRPYLLTRALAGKSLTASSHADLAGQMHAVGQYLRVMHRIAFDYPGYITQHTPSAPLDEGAWQHPIWAFEREARRVWAEDRQQVDVELMEAVETFFHNHADDLRASYAQPHFTHGDCHASQFFVVPDESGWQVSGVLDLEVASAGAVEADFVQFGIEMAGLYPARLRWWDALFAGYGAVPAFELVKLRMLALQHASYSWIWPGSRERILRHILTAADWHALYDLTSLGGSI